MLFRYFSCKFNLCYIFSCEYFKNSKLIVLCIFVLWRTIIQGKCSKTVGKWVKERTKCHFSRAVHLLALEYFYPPWLGIRQPKKQVIFFELYRDILVIQKWSGLVTCYHVSVFCSWRCRNVNSGRDSNSGDSLLLRFVYDKK